MTRQQVNVLLIEDNPGDARLVQEALAELSSPKFKLTQVDRLDEGLLCLEKRRYDVLLLDLLLEDAPRLGTLMEIYDHADKVPIVVLTGLEDETVGLWTLAEGAEDYLIKGRVDPLTLKQSILSAIERHEAKAGQLPAARPSSRRARRDQPEP